MIDFQNDVRLKRPGGEATAMQVTAGVCALRETPEPDGRLATVALHGETLDTFEERGGFFRAQAHRDGYVAWADAEALSAPVLKATHKVIALRTYVLSEPALKSAPHFLLSFGAEIVAEGETGDWVTCARAGYVHKRHLAPLDYFETDPVLLAERLIGTPYLWGGRESLGLDCSGLVQGAYASAGVILPRDADLQYEAAGEPIADWRVPGALRRGDLVFWEGHVGIMADAIHLIHANASAMAVAREPLDEAIQRIAALYAEPIGARRIDLGHARQAASSGH
jgi:cell wall-associated NlpC family hydrolase